MDGTEVSQELVRRRYADLAVTASRGAGCCTDDEKDSFGHSRYDPQQVAQLPEAAAPASLGCGSPTAMFD